jgi:hypothetical protein
MQTQMDKQEAIDFFSEFFFGEHHFPGELKEWGNGWIIRAQNNLSTYDFNHLTRLVVMAHDKAIRVEIVPKGMNIIYIAIHKRSREGDYYERHPTMEDAIKKIRASPFLNK